MQCRCGADAGASAVCGRNADAEPGQWRCCGVHAVYMRSTRSACRRHLLDLLAAGTSLGAWAEACGWPQPRGLGRLGHLGLGLGLGRLGRDDLYECVVVTVARAAHVHDHSVQIVIQPRLCKVVR